MVRFAARHEYAMSVEDMLARRSRLLFLDARLASEQAVEVGRILLEETGADPGVDAFLGHQRKVAQNYAATTSVNTSNTENYLVQQWLNDFVQVTCWCHLRNFTMVARFCSLPNNIFCNLPKFVGKTHFSLHNTRLRLKEYEVSAQS